jgi:hypothetical protein
VTLKVEVAAEPHWEVVVEERIRSVGEEVKLTAQGLPEQLAQVLELRPVLGHHNIAGTRQHSCILLVNR